MAIEWKDICDDFFLTSAHEEELVEAPSSKVAYHKIKPTTVLDHRKCKIGVDRSDQMMSYYLLERKMIKWWKKLFVHLFGLAVVIAQTLHTKTNKQKYFAGNFLQTFAEGLLASNGR